MQTSGFGSVVKCGFLFFVDLGSDGVSICR